MLPPAPPLNRLRRATVGRVPSRRVTRHGHRYTMRTELFNAARRDAASEAASERRYFTWWKPRLGGSVLPELRAAWGAVWSSANDGSCRPLPVSSATDKFQQQAWKCSPNLQWVITFSKSREDSTLLFGLRSSSVLLKTRNNGIRLPGSRFRAELIKRVRVFKRLLPASSQCNYNVISENMCAIFQPFLVVGVIVIMSPAVTSTKPGIDHLGYTIVVVIIKAVLCVQNGLYF